jgi:phosphopantothenoylcysteine decarboxylase / phosphopantothenate---cysteine ligase
MNKHPKTVLISAGPTIEPIDPVRFISNHSTGKMGYALAKACIQAGHQVILVSGPTQLDKPEHCKFISVQTAREMEKIMVKHFPKADIIFKVAAVADYRVKKVATKKIKKTSNTLNIPLIKNPDILKRLGKMRKSHQVLVGFAAETHQGVTFAKKKLKEKNLDWIVLNDISGKEVGFASNNNAVVLINREGKKTAIAKQSKFKIAQKILKAVTKIPVQHKQVIDFNKFSAVSWLKLFGLRKK